MDLTTTGWMASGERHRSRQTRNCDGPRSVCLGIPGEEHGGEPMYISCLATDYDGTLAHDGVVDGATADALVAFRRSGRRLLLVTGRELPDIVRVFPRIELFDRVVAENGALLFEPATKKNPGLLLNPRQIWWRPCAKRASAHFRSGDPLSQPGSQTKVWFSMQSVNTDLSCKLYSIRERSWCCLPASTKPAA